MRRKIHTQLNKGERLHALRVFRWFGGDGLIRRKQEEAQQDVVDALNLALVKSLVQKLIGNWV